MTQQIRIGALGAASITPVALIQPASQIADVSVHAIAASNVQRANDFALKYGICKVMPSYETLIESDEIDAVYIALPIANHLEWSIRALQAGKHVLCEKTLAQNATEARILQDVAIKCKRNLVEAFHYRHHPLIHRLLELVQKRIIGEIEFIKSHFYASIPERENDIRWMYELGGGSTMELGCYTIHLVRAVMGEEPRVRSAKAIIGPPKIDVYMESDLMFPNGVLAQVISSMAHMSKKTDTAIELYGSHGTIQITNPFAPHLGHTLTIEKGENYQVETISGETTYLHQLRAFVALLCDGRAISTGIKDSIANMQIIDDIYRAAGLPPRGI